MSTSLTPMGVSHTDRELGILRAEVDHLKEDIKEVKSEVKEIKADVRILISKFDQTDGGKAALWKLLMLVSTVSGVVSAAVTVIFKFL